MKEKETYKQRMAYEEPKTRRTRMQLEKGLCVVPSAGYEPATIKESPTTVEVEDYKDLPEIEIEFN